MAPTTRRGWRGRDAVGMAVVFVALGAVTLPAQPPRASPPPSSPRWSAPAGHLDAVVQPVPQRCRVAVADLAGIYTSRSSTGNRAHGAFTPWAWARPTPGARTT
jgi:hypothetical protein